MCDPVTLAATSFAIGAVGKIAEYDAQRKAKRENDRAARSAYQQTVADLNARTDEERIAALSRENQVSRQGVSAAALARVSAASAGVEGNSVDAAQHNIAFDEGMAKTTIQENLGMTLRQLQRQQEGSLALEQSRINSVAAPNPWLAALQIGGSALKTAGQIDVYRNPPKSGGSS